MELPQSGRTYPISAPTTKPIMIWVVREGRYHGRRRDWVSDCMGVGDLTRDQVARANTTRFVNRNAREERKLARIF